MRFFDSRALSALAFQSTLPRGITHELVLNYTGDAAAAVTVTAANLGRVRVAYAGTDIVNMSVADLLDYNNLKKGVARFSSAVGAAFVATVVVPFHAPFDDKSGAYFADKQCQVFCDFPALTPAVIDSGTVSAFIKGAPSVAAYTLLLLQRNLNFGAGSGSQELEQSNISSIYVRENANVTGYLVHADGIEKINAPQAILLDNSNSDNRVETAITLIELRLNQLNEVSRLLNRIVRVQAQTSAAADINLFVECIAFSEAMTKQSGEAFGLDMAKVESAVKASVRKGSGLTAAVVDVA